MKKSQRRRSVSSGDIIDEINPRNHHDSDNTSGSSGEIISLIDDETDTENDEKGALRDAADDTRSTDIGVTSFDGQRTPAKKPRHADSGDVEL